MTSPRLLAAAAALLVGSACSQVTQTSSAHDYERDIEHWALPLDAYHHPMWDTELDSAYTLFFFPCMADKGFDLGERPPATYPFQGVTVTRSNRLLFSLAIAQQFGYVGPESPEPPQPPADVLASLDTPQGKAARTACSDAARDEVPVRPTSGLLSSLEQAAYDTAAASPAALRASVEWRGCMAPLGIADLPDWPEEMPSDSMTERFRRAPERIEHGTAGVEEIELAVKDAECREQTGWFEELYNAEWDTQLELIERNEDALQHIADADQEHAELVRAAIDRAQ